MSTPAADSAHTSRLKAFKNKGRSDNEELRRRRNEVSVELRKSKKDDMLSKRRNVEVDDGDSDTDAGARSPLAETQAGAGPMSMEDIHKGILSGDAQMQYLATQAARRILSRERHPPIDALIAAGLVPVITKFLANAEHPKLQFEAAWALTNIASGTSQQTRVVVDAGAVPHFVALLRSSDVSVCEQAVWALGNIAGDGAQLRDHVVNNGILKPLLALVDAQGVTAAFLRNITWTISNLCRNKNPHPSLEVVRQCLPALIKLMAKPDLEIQADSCWAMSYLTDGDNERIEEVVQSGAIDPLVACLMTGELPVITPALRALGNIVTGSDTQTDAVLASPNALPVLAGMLSHQRMNLVKEAAWTISNITAGNVAQIQKVIDNNVIEPLIQVLITGDFKAQKEAAWAVTNLTSGGSIEQIVTLCRHNLIQPFCQLLSCNDEKAVTVVLDGLTNILQAACNINELETMTNAIEECGGLDLIEGLQSHENTAVYEKSLAIIENYFGEEEDEVADLQPATTGNPAAGAGEAFAFSANAAPSSEFNF